MNDPFKPFRRKISAWKNWRRLKNETAYYHERFMEKKLAIPGEAEIIASIQSRFPEQTPRLKGNLNLLAIYHDYNWEGSSLGPALAAFGTVRHLDWRDPQLAGGRSPGSRDWLEKMNEGLLCQATAWNAERPFDAVFTYLSGEQVTPEWVAALHGLGAPLINLALNDKESFIGKVRKGRASGAREICRHFDLCWTSTMDALEKYVVEGATPIYLPEGANPEVHRPYPEEKIYDVSFVGQCYGNRPDIISRLKEAGLRVEVFGQGWPNGALSTAEMVRTWSRSRINLGFGGVLGHQETFSLKGRDFEVPLSGGLYLTEHNDELLQFYELDREIITYLDFGDLVRKIHWLLANPEAAVAIRQAGRERVLREHTWQIRFERVLRLTGVLV